MEKYDFITEGGYYLILTPNKYKARSGLYPIIEIDSEPFSLIYSELDRNKSFRYGTGYAEYSGEIERNNLKLLVKQEFLMHPKKKAGMIGNFAFKNTGSLPIEAQIVLRSDFFPIPILEQGQVDFSK